MKIIADSSASRTEWALVDGASVVEHAFTKGLNPFFQTRRDISHSIRLDLPEAFLKRRWEHIYFYGAGCIGQEKKKIVESSLIAQFKSPVTVESDLLGAARGLLVTEPGLACILGSGSNSCYYDGVKIVDNVSPLGYILGDEGSGAVLGKLLVGDVLKNQLPAALCEKFLKQYGLDRQKIIESVYKKPAANRFLASLSPFLIENIEEPAVHRLVLNAFKAFFVRNIENYEGYKTMPVSFVGSVAYYYRDVLEEAASSLGIKVGTVIKSPMEGLVKYHSN